MRTYIIIDVRTRKECEYMSPNKVGRPKSADSKDDRIYIRVTKEEKNSIQKFSKENGLSILDLIRKGIESVKKK